jgi:poly(3-hydroxybutyrate) depolymerase
MTPMPSKTDFGSEWEKLLWPTLFAAEAGAAFAQGVIDALTRRQPPPPQAAPVWATPNEVVLELESARLRRFSSAPGKRARSGQARSRARPPLLVCAPFALHDARIADLCEGHSLMARLCAGGGRVYLVEWLSAKKSQVFRRIDDYLSDLNIMVDEIGGLCDFAGLCQGGWLGLIYAARFPAKAGKLVVAGAPVDTHVVESPLSALARSTPIEAFREVVRLGDGLAHGAMALQFWGAAAESDEQIHALLQSDLPLDSERFAGEAAIFRAWSQSPLDLPGAYYLEVVERLYKDNQLARGAFVALGRTIDLRDIRGPLYLIAARDDDVAAPEQTFACAGLVGTPAPAVRQTMVAGGHLELFVGARALDGVWPDVVAWLCDSAAGQTQGTR